MEYTDPITQEKYIPYCVEPSLGVDRMLLAFLSNAYTEETVNKTDTRTVLKLHPFLAPYKAAVLPLQKNLSENADMIYSQLVKHFPTDFDISGSIGKRYRRQDEIGTPFCITIDYQTLEDNTCTLRDRDTMEQIRLTIPEIITHIQNSLIF